MRFRACLLSLAASLLTIGSAPAAPPAAGPPAPFASGLAGPEALAFMNDGSLAVGTSSGRIWRYAADGTATPLADVGDSLAGITVLRDGRVLAAAYGANRVWAVDPPTGFASLFVASVTTPNWIVQRRRGQILASSSASGTIVDISTGVPVTLASGLNFPNGMAIGRGNYLYVAETGASRISRLKINRNGTLGPAEEYATGLPAADGIALDRRGNLLVVGFDTLFVVLEKTRAVVTLSTDPLLDWPASLAFGAGRGFGRKDLFLANFGLPLGSGSTVVRVPYSLRGAKLVR